MAHDYLTATAAGLFWRSSACAIASRQSERAAGEALAKRLRIFCSLIQWSALIQFRAFGSSVSWLACLRLR